MRKRICGHGRSVLRVQLNMLRQKSTHTAPTSTLRKQEFGQQNREITRSQVTQLHLVSHCVPWWQTLQRSFLTFDLSLQVSWVDHHYLSLSLEDRRIVDDHRFSIVRPYVKEWNLQIRDVSWQDQGQYRCTVNTDPVKSKMVMLHVKGKSRSLSLTFFPQSTRLKTAIFHVKSRRFTTSFHSYYLSKSDFMTIDSVLRICLSHVIVTYAP